MKAAIINATMAERLWPVRMRWAGGSSWARRRLLAGVGVARNAKYIMLGEEPRPFSTPSRAAPRLAVTLHLWTDVDPAALIRPCVMSYAKWTRTAIYNVRTMEEHLNDSAFAMMPLRYGAVLAGAQGLLGLLLAAMGLYGSSLTSSANARAKSASAWRSARAASTSSAS